MPARLLRVLHVSEAFGGGVRTAMVNYVIGTPEFEHSMVLRLRAGHETVEVPEDVDVEYVSGGLIDFFKAALRAVDQGSYDIVHLHSSYAGVLRAFLPKNVRIVYTPHCYVMEAKKSAYRTVTYRMVEKALAQRPQLLMAVSPREAMIGLSLRPSMHAEVVENVAVALPVPFTKAHRNSSKPIITMVGRIMAQKDPFFFAAVARRLGTERFRFMWIGDGDGDGRLALEAAGVEVTGWLPPPDVWDALEITDLYLHTAAWEGGPLSTLEAADAGCALLARTIPSMESLGYPLAGTESEDVASSVERFFADPAYREDVSMTSRQIARNASLENLGRNLAHLYGRAMVELKPRTVRAEREHHRVDRAAAIS